MAQIREQLVLEDQFSGTFGKYISVAQRASGSTKEMKDAAQRAAAQSKIMAAGYREAAAQMRATAAQTQAETAELKKSEQASRAETAAAKMQEQQSRAKVAATKAATAALKQEEQAQRTQAAAAAAATAAAKTEEQQSRAKTAATKAATAALKQEEQAQKTRAASVAAATAAAKKQEQQSRAIEAATKATTAALKQKEQALRTEAAQTRAAAAAAKAHEQQQRAAAASTDALTGKIKSLVASYVSLKAAQGVLNLADTLSQTTARIDMMNDGLQTTAQLNDMIFQSAQRARGAYADTADLVAKLGNLAGDAFGSSREIVAFAEQVNKQIALSGASASGAQAALLQLTQALSSGALRGEELNSILEQTPTIAQTIAKYLGMSTGQMRELASEGGLTAEVVKAALFSAADETNAKFAQLPMTWGQIWQSFQNEALHAFQPVLAELTKLGNSPEFQRFVNMGIQAISAVAQAAVAAFGWIADIATFIADNWSTIGPIFYGVAAAIGTIVTAMALWQAATMAVAAAQAVLNLALSHPVLLAIAAIIGVIVYAISRWVQAVGGLKVAWLIAMDVIQTAWDYVVFGISWGITAILNAMDSFALGWQQVGVAVADFMGQMKVNVLMILQNLINGAIDMINQFIALLNNLPGVNISAVSRVTFGAAAAMEENVKSSQRNIGLGLQAAATAGNKALREGSLTGQWNSIQRDHNQRLVDITLARIENGLNSQKDTIATAGSGSNPFSDIYGSAGAGGIGNTVGGIGKSVGGGLGSDVADIKKEVQLSQEELKSLVDMTERQYVTNVNLTSQTPVITVNGQNTGDTAMDKQALANAIRDILLEQRAAGSIRSIGIPT